MIARVQRAPAVLTVVTLVASLAAARPARADDDPDFAVDRPLHVSLVVGGALGYGLSETLFKPALAPDACRWCGPVLFDAEVRDGLRWGDVATARRISDVTGFAIAPVVALGGIALAGTLGDATGGQTFDDTLIVAEAAVLAGAVNYLVKASVGRERPFVHALPADQKPRTGSPQDNNLSFYSGHSTFTMSLAVAAGSVATRRGYDWAPALWAGGIGLSLTTGYLRIAGDKHWATDVLMGWATGAAIGYLVPRLHARSTPTSITPAATAQTIGFAFAW